MMKIPKSFTRQRRITIQGRTVNAVETAYFPPYDQSGKTNLIKFTRRRQGVYFIFDRQAKKVIYVGYSSRNLYKTLYRHFETWNHPHQEVLSLRNRGRYLIKIIFIRTSLIGELERYYIKKLAPKHNLFNYQLEFIEVTGAPSIQEPTSKEIEVCPF